MVFEQYLKTNMIDEAISIMTYISVRVRVKRRINPLPSVLYSIPKLKHTFTLDNNGVHV